LKIICSFLHLKPIKKKGKHEEAPTIMIRYERSVYLIKGRDVTRVHPVLATMLIF
jgi:hypothetical protein